MKKIIALILLTLIIVSGLYFFNSLRAVGNESIKEIVMIDSENHEASALILEDKGFIKSFTVFNLVYTFLGNKKIEEGGYYISRNMNNF